MTVEELNAVDRLIEISNTASEMIEERHKTFANENLRETANDSLREIKQIADELKKEIIGRIDYYSGLILLEQITDIERILRVFDEDKTALLFINAENPRLGIQTLDPSSDLKERILDAMRAEVKRLNAEFEKL